VIRGLDWVLANHAQQNIRVVNLSLSESAPSSYQQSMLDTAVERLWRAGVVVVASAGNRGANTASYAPANDPFIITVGALDMNGTASDGDDFVASFSSGGRTQDGYDKPEIVAPGRRIGSMLPAGTSLLAQAPLTSLLSPGYAIMSGTSFSAPQVAGAAALLLQQHPDWTPDQVKAVLTDTARSVSGSGAKRLDLAAATAYSGVPNPANDGLTPTYYGLDPATTTDLTGASWNGASWNGASWNGASWNGASWNSFGWN
jgi:serine protease AprX